MRQGVARCGIKHIIFFCTVFFCAKVISSRLGYLWFSNLGTEWLDIGHRCFDSLAGSAPTPVGSETRIRHRPRPQIFSGCFPHPRCSNSANCTHFESFLDVFVDVFGRPRLGIPIQLFNIRRQTLNSGANGRQLKSEPIVSVQQKRPENAVVRLQQWQSDPLKTRFLRAVVVLKSNDST